MWNENGAVLILHTGEQLHQHHCRVRRPIAIVPAMQSTDGTENRDLQLCIPARSEDNCLLAALVYWSITNKPHIAMNEIPVGIQNGFQMWRARFFFPLPDEADIRTKRDLGGMQSVEGSQLRHDCGFIVRGRSRKDTIFPIDLAQDRREGRIAVPLGRSDRLPIVVSIENDRVPCVRGFDLSENYGIHPWKRQQS